MQISELCKFLKIKKIYNDTNCVVDGFSIDTRKIKSGDCYIGITGEKFDGNLFFKSAFEKGAVVAIIDKFDNDELDYLKQNNKMVILVEDTIKALGDLARVVREKFNKPVVAITGSAGKTSTKDMIYSVLKEKYNAQKTIGNQNNQLGLPLSILRLEKDCDTLVLEMGMNHLGEISYLTNIAKPNVAIITNVGTAHIGNLGSRENILKAKLEILEGLDENGTVIINNDNDLLHEWYLKNKNNYNIITIGFKNKSDVFAKDIIINAMDSSFKIGSSLIHVPVAGEHFIYNSLVAIAVGSLFHVPMKQIQKGINNFELTQNRMDIINSKNDITIIDDSYNANFDSVKYALKFLSNQSGRRIAVLGTMRELGEYSEKLHTKLGDVVVEENIDILITVGEYTNYINKRAEELGFDKNNSYHFNKNADAIKLINRLKQKDDVILVKASYMLNFKEIVDNIK